VNVDEELTFTFPAYVWLALRGEARHGVHRHRRRSERRTEEREEGTRNPLPGSDLDLRRAKALDEAVTVLDGYFAPRAK
jgi:hypothetical protein